MHASESPASGGDPFGFDPNFFPTALVERQQDVEVHLEKTSWNSRKLFASINIGAPVETVWGALTDYDGLHNFIPSLVVSTMDGDVNFKLLSILWLILRTYLSPMDFNQENKCLERRANGALIRQVGGI